MIPKDPPETDQEPVQQGLPTDNEPEDGLEDTEVQYTSDGRDE